MVAGKVLVRDREVLIADKATMRTEAQVQIEKVVQRVAAAPVQKEMVLLGPLQDLLHPQMLGGPFVDRRLSQVILCKL